MWGYSLGCLPFCIENYLYKWGMGSKFALTIPYAIEINLYIWGIIELKRYILMEKR